MKQWKCVKTETAEGTTLKATFALIWFCKYPVLLYLSYAFKLPRFCTKMEWKTSILSGHIHLIYNKNAAKNIRCCAFTMLRFCEAHNRILEPYRKPPLLCVHIDLVRFQKPPFLWISIFYSVFENLRFSGVFVRISVKTFIKNRFFSIRFCINTEQYE